MRLRVHLYKPTNETTYIIVTVVGLIIMFRVMCAATKHFGKGSQAILGKEECSFHFGKRSQDILGKEACHFGKGRSTTLGLGK